MTIKDFTERYQKCAANIQKENLIKEILTDKTFGFADKMAIAKTIARRSSHNADGKFEVNTAFTAFFYTIEILRNYTTLELGENLFKAYDALDQANALTAILDAIPAKDRQEINVLSKVCLDDEIANNSNVFKQIENLINSFGDVVTAAIASMTDEDKGNIIRMLKAEMQK